MINLHKHTAQLCIQIHTFIGVNVRVPLKFPLLEDELEDVANETLALTEFALHLSRVHQHK